MPDILDKILAEVCLDSRIPDGIFDMSNNVHMEVLRENLMDGYNVSLQDAISIHNKMIEGKYPERQAYNKDGLLVTFPTPQHKQRAIQRGTHFEKSPTAGQQNVFGGGQQPQGGQPAPAQAPTPAGGAPVAPEAPQQNIFPQGGEQPAQAPAQPPAGGQAAPSSLPASSAPPPAPAPAGGTPSALPPSAAPAPAAPEPPPTAAPQNISQPQPEQQPAPPKPKQERAAEAQIVKQMMKGEDPSDQTLSQAAITEGQLKDDAGLRLVNLILEYATWAKGQPDQQQKQKALVTIEALADRFVKAFGK